MISNEQKYFEQFLQEQSLWVAEQRNRGYSKGIPQRETTITDVVLLTLATAMGPALETEFSKESVTGADWLWKNPTSGKSVACQAKVLDFETKDYREFAHVVGGHAGNYQVDLLRQYAKSKNALACYILYNSGLYHPAPDPDNHGCFVVLADKIDKQIIANVNTQYTGDVSLTWEAIKPDALPWHWIASYLYS